MSEDRSDALGGDDGFLRRQVGPSPADQAAMLGDLGYSSMSEMLQAAIPPSLRSARPFDLPAPASEAAVAGALRALAERNERWTSLVGMGYYGTSTPAVIRRNVLESPSWYTAYTPYQAEISQGRLEAMLNFQTMVCDLTGLAVANASLLDEATAAAEAMMMCRAGSDVAGSVFLVDELCHPQTIDVIRTRARARGIEVLVGDPEVEFRASRPFGVVLAYPATTGAVRELGPLVASARRAGARVAVAADILALALLVPPGELGADIALGTTQRFGVPMWYGGPHAAYLATTKELERVLPGRLVGVSLDAEGRPAYRLALQAREQHIRRERASSNICTAQALLASVAGLYAVYHGAEGLRSIAARVHHLTTVLAEGLRRSGVEVVTRAFFDTITVATGSRTAQVLTAARAERINLRQVDAGHVGLSLDETSTPDLVETLWACFGAPGHDVHDLGASVPSPLPATVLRTSPYLTHPVFSQHRTETEMLRYLRALADRDLALDRSMIPLGSCTMKLNATTALEAISLPGFTDLHPYAPPDQALGYRQVVEDLQAWLCELSGYDAVSLQPNAGSQGEFAGLLAIRAYHEARGEGARNVCLVPTSAHGTNAASAALAGMAVVALSCGASGAIDPDDLQAKLDTHASRLAAIMLTYPSTSGVYEEGIDRVCTRVHEAGGQVYIDGANMNALLGFVRLAEIGGDVSHFNLHKTFAIPHGGGGPGIGPIGVRRHLAPFLPGSRLAPDLLPGAGGGPVAAAPFGSAGVLPISWVYIRMLGTQGMQAATAAAVLAANYVAWRLSSVFPVLYRGPGGLVAHECVLDLRELTKRTGVTTEDVAKRLADYGFHAPTMSFPVPGTLMVEPTESEPRAELDRFCDAMVAIRSEIAEIEAGQVDVASSALRRAPHTAAAVVEEHWDRPYSRERAVFPDAATRSRKYWPPVARIDNAYGDRNLLCSCPTVDEVAMLGL